MSLEVMDSCTTRRTPPLRLPQSLLKTEKLGVMISLSRAKYEHQDSVIA